MSIPALPPHPAEPAPASAAQAVTGMVSGVMESVVESVVDGMVGVAGVVQPMQRGVQRQGNLVMAEAAQISNGTLDYALLLGAALGLLFGVALPANMGGNLELASTLVQGSLFGHLASLSVVFIISVRIIVARGMRDQSWVAVDDGHHVMLRHIAASAWAALVALLLFLLAALAGYALGLMLGLPGLAGDMLGTLADSYRVGALVHVGLRVLVQAAAVAWISFFDMIVLSQQHEDLSRSITRKLLLLLCAVIGIEAFDAYLSWVWGWGGA